MWPLQLGPAAGLHAKCNERPISVSGKFIACARSMNSSRARSPLIQLRCRAAPAEPSVLNTTTDLLIAVLWADRFRAGLIGTDFNGHKIWAMLLALIAWGPRMFLLDCLIAASGHGEWCRRQAGLG
jgi:hypothetical protein